MMTEEEPNLGENLGAMAHLPSRKQYSKPSIILELELETHAGSPLSIDPLDPEFGP
jgi:hypothetical protein